MGCIAQAMPNSGVDLRAALPDSIAIRLEGFHRARTDRCAFVGKTSHDRTPIVLA